MADQGGSKLAFGFGGNHQITSAYAMAMA